MVTVGEKWELRFSELEGRALYATERIRQGEEILKLPYIVQTKPDMYSIQVNPDIHIDCSSSPAGALNHSCNANAFVKGMRVLAWSCIEAGSMITIDYRRTEDIISYPFNCLCGSKLCEGRIE